MIVVRKGPLNDIFSSSSRHFSACRRPARKLSQLFLEKTWFQLVLSHPIRRNCELFVQNFKLEIKNFLIVGIFGSSVLIIGMYVNYEYISRIVYV